MRHLPAAYTSCPLAAFVIRCPRTTASSTASEAVEFQISSTLAEPATRQFRCINSAAPSLTYAIITLQNFD
ncbi:hypothetical protein EFQ99_25470 [Rhizobium vallis]|uniref:Uncharacterized protein n=1 Tax=Rhizobium vallis TaxID=634290 RepID=A0A3S0S802_9HYPH|nr:hypothetical protein EFQ99_25470 [Rhizobium vallis]